MTIFLTNEDIQPERGYFENDIVISYQIDKLFLFLFFAFTICNSFGGKVKFTFKVHPTATFPYGFVFEHVEMIDIESVVADRRFGG